MRRERDTILGDILDALARGAHAGETRMTRLALRVNLPYDRFVQYVDELRRQGLVNDNEPPRLTQKGEQLLRRFRAWKEALRLFGLRTTPTTHDS